MSEPREPWTRADWGLFALLVLGALVSLAWTVHPWFEAGPETTDAALYILCARSLAAGDGYQMLGEAFLVRPPGWSALLAPLVARDAAGFHALNLLTSLFGVATVALLFVYVRAALGRWIAFALALAVWLDADFQTLCNRTLSDVPGFAALLGCLLLERLASRAHSWRRELALGVAIGLATYLRSIAILLVPAIVVARCFDARRRKEGLRHVLITCLPFALAALAVKLPWDVRNALLAPSTAIDQNLVHSYSTGMWHVDPGDPHSAFKSFAELLAPLGTRLEAIGALVGSGMGLNRSFAWAVVGWLALGCVAWSAWTRRRAGDFFVLGSTALLAVYFGFGERLILPTYVLALPAVAELVAGLARSVHRGVARELVLVPAFVVLAIVGCEPRRGWNEIERMHIGAATLAANLAREVPVDAKLAAVRGWHMSVFMQRPVYSLHFAVRRAGLHGTDIGEALRDLLRRRDIDFVALLPTAPDDRNLLEFFTANYGRPREVGGALVFAVR